MKRLLLTVAGVGLTTTLVMAQTQSVRGKIVDASTGEAIIGANVIVKGHTNIGAATNLDGVFTLNAPRGAKTLIVSYIGYKSQEVAIANNLTIKLSADASQLDDVVVIAYGVQKKESLVGAQTTISAKNLEKRPITNLTSAFSGLTPGVQVTTSAGQPGSSESLIVRGFGSLNASSNPIIVVDGSIYNGALGDINPQDIQSLNVLKDAASTAVYGASAGNGVILVTTKSGRAGGGSKPTFNFSMNQGVAQRGQSFYETIGTYDHHKIRWQQWFNENKYELGQADALAGANAALSVVSAYRYNPFAGIKSYYDKNAALTTDPAQGLVPAIIMADGTLNPEITGLLYGDDLDWEKGIFRTGHRQDYNFSASYSTNSLKSYFSVGYLNEEGYRIGTSFERFTGRANVSYQLNKWLEVGTNTSYSTATSLAPRQASGSYNSNSFNFVQRIAPIYPIHQHDATGAYVLGSNGERLYDYSATRPFSPRFNPVYEAEVDLSSQIRDQISTKNFIKITPLKGLAITANYALDLNSVRGKVRYSSLLGDSQGKGIMEAVASRYKTVTSNQLVDYARSFNKHNFNLLLGHESFEYEIQSLAGDKDQVIWEGIDELVNYVNMTALSSSTTRYTKESFFGRLTYDFDTKYNASFSFRRDGSSRFHPDNRWGNFWSIGAGWNLHREDFLKSSKWINQLKLRASYGMTGNDGLSSYFPFRTLYTISSYNHTSPGSRISNLGNTDLIWETQVSADLAVEFRFFNRLHGTIEFFNKESKDLLFDVPLPASTGVGSQSQNIGKVRNWGVEFDLGYDIIQKSDLRWSVKLNGTVYKNRLLTLPELQRETGIETGNYKYMEGHSIYDYYLKQYKGVDPADGKAMYLLDAERYPNQANPAHADFAGVDREGERAAWTKNGDIAKRDFSGSAIPDLYGGFGTDLQWKGIDFSVSFAYQLGGKAYDGMYQGLMGRDLQGGSAMHVDLYNAWRKPGDVTDVPRLDSKSTDFSTTTSTRWLTSRSALMLKSLSIGYTLPKSFVEKFGIGSARVSLAGENLFLLSARKGLNPMSNFGGSTGAAYYGYSKVFTASLNLSL